MKKHIHVNQHVIKSNKSKGEREPVLTVKTYKDNTYGHRVIIKDDNGNEVASLVYTPDKPLSCGASVYITTKNDVEIVNETTGDVTVK